MIKRNDPNMETFNEQRELSFSLGGRWEYSEASWLSGAEWFKHVFGKAR